MSNLEQSYLPWTAAACLWAKLLGTEGHHSSHVLGFQPRAAQSGLLGGLENTVLTAPREPQEKVPGFCWEVVLENTSVKQTTSSFLPQSVSTLSKIGKFHIVFPWHCPCQFLPPIILLEDLFLSLPKILASYSNSCLGEPSSFMVKSLG